MIGEMPSPCRTSSSLFFHKAGSGRLRLQWQMSVRECSKRTPFIFDLGEDISHGVSQPFQPVNFALSFTGDSALPRRAGTKDITLW